MRWVEQCVAYFQRVIAFNTDRISYFHFSRFYQCLNTQNRCFFSSCLIIHAKFRSKTLTVTMKMTHGICKERRTPSLRRENIDIILIAMKS